jgi:hypothetical protein
MENPPYAAAFFVLIACIGLLPLIRKVPTGLLDSWGQKRLYSIGFVAISVAFSGWVAYGQYDARVARVVELQKLIFAEEWERAIEVQEETPSRTLVGQFLYNTALSETDRLLERLFFGPQDFGPDALVLPWSVENLNYGAHFYYAIGLMNEAHRWAYEDMVTFGYRPENLKVLARTSLLNGDYRMVKKYTSLLRKTLFYRNWAEGVDVLADQPDLMMSEPDLAGKLNILPKNDFFVEYNYPPNTLIRLLEAQPDNKAALEYLLAGFLLGKNLEGVVGSIQGLRAAGYTHIPRHVEEAAMILLAGAPAGLDLGGLSISEGTRARFEQYSAFVAGARRNPSVLRERMQERFGDTYWFYYQFR